MSALRGGMFQLFCFILQKSESHFHVDVAASGTVSHLKDAILKKNPNTLRNVDSHQLKLYKVCDFCGPSSSTKPTTSHKHYITPANIKAQLDNVQLSSKDLLEPTELLSSTFRNASRGDIHVIGIVQARAAGECIRYITSQPLHLRAHCCHR